jgi:phytoene dehydrogenase-like protein
MTQQYDTVIIGAGMSGLGAGIRLAMFDKKVCIIEKHSIPGGLNSWYKRGKRVLDTGLHAMTNFAVKGDKKKPLGKLLKQLRIPYEAFELVEQSFSLIDYPNTQLRFSNDIDELTSSVVAQFPQEKESWLKLLKMIEEYDELQLAYEKASAREFLASMIHDPLLCDMILCPLLSYGSAWENDMDYNQFVIMFKAVFLEGFSRPAHGIKPLIDLLEGLYKKHGGEIIYRNGVEKINTKDGVVQSVTLKKGDVIECKQILSCAGYAETMKFCEDDVQEQPKTGALSFTESIFYTSHSEKTKSNGASIIFQNKTNAYAYRSPQQLYDPNSALLSFPHNFSDIKCDEAIFRVTSLANYQMWKDLDKQAYKEAKSVLEKNSFAVVKQFYPDLSEEDISYSDTFTPTTVEKYTSRIGGAIYGSPDKQTDGKTKIENLFLCGTDQGFLGITGAILSGITIANLYSLK